MGGAAHALSGGVRALIGDEHENVRLTTAYAGGRRQYGGVADGRQGRMQHVSAARAGWSRWRGCGGLPCGARIDPRL